MSQNDTAVVEIVKLAISTLTITRRMYAEAEL